MGLLVGPSGQSDTELCIGERSGPDGGPTEGKREMKTTLSFALALVGLGTIALPAQAELGLIGWTPMVGLSSGPDQFVVGTQLDFGTIVPSLHLLGNMDVGFGDDLTVVTAGPSAVFMADVEGAGSFYAGANFSLVYINLDVPDIDVPGVDFDDSDTDFGFAGQVGWLYPMGSNALNVDLKFELADYPDAKVMLGYRFALTE